MTVRIAFTLIGGGKGTGGYNYLVNLVRVLLQHEPDRISPVLIVGVEDSDDEIAPFLAIPHLEIVRSPSLNRSHKSAALAASLFWGVDPPFRRLLDQLRIDVVFESAQFFGWRLRRPVIAWIPDFQHRHLPHMFTRRGYWRRELGFHAELAAGRTIMLSSEDAKQDCERFYPASRGRTKAVRFAVIPSDPPSQEMARDVADSYGLPAHFVFMPNQLSKHKNHLLVLDALDLLRRQGRQVVVVSSGKQDDERHPDYFPMVLDRLNALNLHHEFRLLGMIPYPHVRALMCSSMALLNPSLFEGWSTPVEEARGLGAQLLLSDLDVHREQAGDQAQYFDRQSAASLAEALQRLQPLTDAAKAARMVQAQEAVRLRVRQFAAEFVALVSACVAGERRQ